MLPYYMKFLRHIYFVILGCSYFMTYLNYVPSLTKRFVINAITTYFVSEPVEGIS